MTVLQRFVQILIALDQLANTLVWVGDSYGDETLSARSWREGMTHKGWRIVRIFIDKLFFFDPQHCFMSYLAECQRRQLPSNYKQCHYEDWVV